MPYKDLKKRWECASKSKRKRRLKNPEVTKMMDKKRNRARKINLRKRAKSFFGNNCSICKEELDWDSMLYVNLHCIDGTRHHASAVRLPRLWNKCILLCGRCHRLIHRLERFYTEQQVEDILYFVDILREAKSSPIV